MGVGRPELGGGSKQLKIPPGGGFGSGCKMSYIFFWRGGVGGGGPGNLEPPLGTPLEYFFEAGGLGCGDYASALCQILHF